MRRRGTCVAGPAGEVRERILQAALTVLREGGIRHISQVQVSRRAGVRQSHLTYYFPTRHDLLEATTMRFVESLAQGIVAADNDRKLRSIIVRGTQRMEAALADALGGERAREQARVVLATMWGIGLYHFALRPPPQADPTRPYLAWVAQALRT